MARWISDDKLRYLSLAGRVDSGQDKARRAREWNGNVEPVTITSGGVESRHATPNSRPVVQVSKHLPEYGSKGAGPTPKRQAGVAPGPLTQQCREEDAPNRKAGTEGAVVVVSKRGAHKVAPSSAAPLYPLVGLCRGVGLPEPKPEFRFHATRKWRFDYAWPTQRVALEVDGGVWTQGRHTRGAGAIADMEKASEAAILGWRVLYVVPDDLRSGVALDRVARALRPLEFAA